MEIYDGDEKCFNHFMLMLTANEKSKRWAPKRKIRILNQFEANDNETTIYFQGVNDTV